MQKGLVRGIRRWDLVAVTINGVIGAGIFGLPSQVYALIGPYSLIAFIACALVVALIVLCFAEVGSRFSDTGGPYLYAREAFGSVAGFEVGWLIWVARLTAFAANCNLLIDYLGYFHPGVGAGWPRAVVIVAVVVALTAVNVVGVRNAALFSDVFTVGKLIPLLLFIGAGLFFLDPGNFSAPGPPEASSFSKSVLLLVYAFTGFEMAMIPAGETRDPQRNVPFAILISLVVVAAVYILIQVVCIGTFPGLATSRRPLAGASELFMGAIGASVVTAGVAVSVIGNLSVVILSAARLPFAMAAARELPKVFAATHARFHTPHVAIIATAALMMALTLSSKFISSLTVSVIARLLAYVTTCAALIVLRRRDEREMRFKAQFKTPAGVAVSIAALALGGWLLAHSSMREARDTALAALAGLLIYCAYKLVGRKSDLKK
ncbi:MAG TPA: amino acid permease [Blastocatellia bacterium]|jgi:amino acid transporter|nr:amino acid permease [Blastocatellia bacterium]